MAYLRSLDDQIQIQIEEGQNLLLGRMLKCDVVLEDGSISSQHARLKYVDGVLRLVDLGSTNGTRINYSLISEPACVLDGDTVEFGNVSFTVDGPELRLPDESGPYPKAMTSLEPIEVSQQLETTMRLPGLEEVVAEEEDEESGEPSPDEPDPAPEHGDPVRLSFLLALALILIAGLLLLTGLSRSVPAF